MGARRNKEPGTTGIRLVVTPTVQSELTDTVQVCCKLYVHPYDGLLCLTIICPLLQCRENAWKGWKEVRIEELFGMCYHVSMTEVNNVILPMLDLELKAVITPIKDMVENNMYFTNTTSRVC